MVKMSTLYCQCIVMSGAVTRITALEGAPSPYKVRLALINHVLITSTEGRAIR
jgi:hypothetical protein